MLAKNFAFQSSRVQCFTSGIPDLPRVKKQRVRSGQRKVYSRFELTATPRHGSTAVASVTARFPRTAPPTVEQAVSRTPRLVVALPQRRRSTRASMALVPAAPRETVTDPPANINSKRAGLERLHFQQRWDNMAIAPKARSSYVKTSNRCSPRLNPRACLMCLLPF